jgi:hypothetical protein
MAVGDRGTLCIQRPRTVRPGGVVRWFGRDYQHDRLLSFVGQTVMCHETGTGEVEMSECWYQRVVDARLAKAFRRKRQHRWVIGEWITEVPLNVV